MKLKLSFACLLIATIAFFSSCEKELSVENGGLPPVAEDTGSVSGTAVFSLNGGSGTCTGAVTNGTYSKGTALTSANTATIQVSVDSVGTYSISTSSSNGISFSGSGSFTAAGLQTVTLTGTGTPTSVGNFSYTFGTNRCSFSVVVIDPSAIPAIFTLGGSPAACTGFSLGGTYTSGIPVTAANTVSFQVNVTTPGTYSLTSGVINGISFSGSGIFTTTGNQSVALKASGTPTTSGSSSFTITQAGNSCTFSVPVTAPAAFTLSGAPGSCTPATTAGTYQNGTALTMANTVTIEVNVSSLGGYTVSSNTVNGITFTGSGSFTTLGAQNIVLTGTGTPTAAGTFTFTPQVGTSGCTFDIVTAVAPPPSTDYLRVKIDGILKTFNVNLKGDTTDLFLPNTVVVEGDNAVGSDEHIDVTVQSATPITPGTYLQGLGLSFSTSRYFDPVSGQGWQAGTPSLPPLKVVITSITSTRVTGTFSGQFFDFNGTGTNSKQLTQGEFSVPFQ